MRSWTSLRQRADFLRLQQNGQKWITPAFVIQLARTDSSDTTEIGFTATKKLGSAVIRNRSRRRLRAACDQIIPAYATKGCQFVLIARSDVLTRDFAQLTKDLGWALRKLGIEQNEQAS